MTVSCFKSFRSGVFVLIFKAKLIQKGQKSAKVPNQNFQGQMPSKNAKFDKFGFAQGQMAQWER